jgi:predicted GNAT superfamily acetyltransferase
VAATLKWAQRERVMANDIDLITWTYDPLEAPNARLNLRTLGGVARVYRQNIYGENFGALGKAANRSVFGRMAITSDRCSSTIGLP